MDPTDLLEKAKEILPKDDFARYSRILNRKMESCSPVTCPDGSENAFVKFELNRKEHELELLRRRKAMNDKVALFEKKRHFLTVERNAKLRKQHNDRMKRISEIQSIRNDQEEDFSERLEAKQRNAHNRRQELREEIVRRIQAHDNLVVRRRRDHRIIPDDNDAWGDSCTCERITTMPKPRVREQPREANRNVGTDAAEARLSILNDKLKAREELVLRNKMEVRRALADKARKFEERSQKNLRNSREDASEKHKRDFESFQAKHVLKNRMALRAETRKELMGHFLKKRTYYNLKVSENQKRLRTVRQLVNDLRICNLRHLSSGLQSGGKKRLRDEDSRLKRIKIKEHRRRIIRKIREVDDPEELNKLKEKLIGVPTLKAIDSI